MSELDVLGAADSPLRDENDLAQDDAGSPFLYRWRFNLKTGEVHEEKVSDRLGEFPRINEQYTGRPNRYGYLAKGAHGSMPRFDGFIKYDFTTGATQTHEFGAERYGGEGVFVPRPNATNEDEGWLMTYVHDQTTDTSELVMINAQDFAGEPVARIPLPQRVPYGFHGIWVP